MTSSKNNDMNINIRHLLVPLTLVSVTVFLLIGYQTTQIMRDRDGLNMTKGQQEKAFQDSQRMQNQLNALLVGTQKLADNGNKNAKVITDKLKGMGIQVMNPDAPAQKQAENAAAPSGNKVTKAPVPEPEIDEDAPVKP